MKKKQKLFLIFIISSLFLITKNVKACECLWGGTFVEMAQKSELVIRAKVIAYGPRLSHGENLYANMTVQIIEIIKGDYKASTLVLLGDPGHLCRPYITPTRFKKDHEYLFALSKSNQNPQEISVCGEYWIKIDGDMANGTELVNDKFVDYSIELKELLQIISNK